jgi:hypothetical protein
VDRVVTHGSHEGSMNCSMSGAAVAIAVSFYVLQHILHLSQQTNTFEVQV